MALVAEIELDSLTRTNGDGNNNYTVSYSSTGSLYSTSGISDWNANNYITIRGPGSGVSQCYYTFDILNSTLNNFIKNDYDYIILSLDVYFSSIDSGEIVNIYFRNTKIYEYYGLDGNTTVLKRISYLLTYSEMNIINTNPDSISELKVELYNSANNNSIGTHDHVTIYKNCKFYVVNRIDLWGKDSITNNSVYQQSRGLYYYYPGGTAVNDTKRIVNTSINTNNYNTIEVDGEMLTAAFNDGVPVGTLKSNVYDIQKEVLSTGFPMTMWFRLFVNPGGYGFGTTTYIDPADISFSILVNDEIAKQIPYLSDCPVEPNYEFDFRNTSIQNVVTNTGSSTSTSYSAVRSGSTGIDRIEGTILDNDTLDSSNNDGKYFKILKNATTNELWSMDEMDFSIELEFIVYDTTETNQRVFNISASESNTTGNNNSIQLFITNSGGLRYSIYQEGSQKIISEINISSNKLYHVCLTYSETNETAKFYLDGVLIDTYSGVNTTLSNASYFWIGRNLIINTSDYFNGSVRYFRMWTERELTLNEIKMRYDILRGRHNIYYTTTEDLSTTDDVRLKIQATSSQSAVKARDFFFFDRMINVAPSAANVIDGGVEVNSTSTMNVTGNIFNSNLIGEIAMFYQDSEIPPFGYLWCDGTGISTTDDEKYRTLIEILNDGVTRGSTSVDTTISCNLPDYMIDSTGCHLLQAQNNNNLYTNFKHNYQGPEQTITTDQTVVGNYTLDSNYFPSHSHTITTNSTTTNTSFNHNGLHFNVQNLYHFQNIENSNGSSRGGDGGNSTTNHASHTHGVNNFQKIYIEDSTEYTTTINKQYSYTSSQISFENTGNTTSTHIPLSFKVKYAIKYL